MTDLEMTKLCSEAMGLTIAGSWDQRQGLFCTNNHGIEHVLYHPLHDDAQAMALVKKVGLEIIALHYSISRKRHSEDWTEADMRHRWSVSHVDGGNVFSKNLNRAIVECVAKMRARKKA